MLTLYVHQSPFVHAIPVVAPRLSQLFIQGCQLSLLLLRARLRLEVLPPPGAVASRFFNGRRSLVAVAPAPPKFIAAAIEGESFGGRGG